MLPIRELKDVDLNDPAHQDKAAPSSAHRAKRLLQFSLAGFFFVLGGLGAVLPGLPATPFLLLTSYFLARSSPKWNAILLRSKFFGPLLTDWQERGGVRLHVKVKATLIVIVMCLWSCWSWGWSIQGLIIGLLGTIGLLVIWQLPTAAPSEPEFPLTSDDSASSLSTLPSSTGDVDSPGVDDDNSV